MKPEDVVIGQRYAIIDNTGKVDIGEMGDSYRYVRPVQKKATTSRMRPETIIKLQEAIFVFKNREKNTMCCSEGYGLRYFEGRADLAAEILEMEGIKDES